MGTLELRYGQMRRLWVKERRDVESGVTEGDEVVDSLKNEVRYIFVFW